MMVRAHLIVVAQSQQGHHIVRVKLQSNTDCHFAISGWPSRRYEANTLLHVKQHACQETCRNFGRLCQCPNFVHVCHALTPA